MLRLFFVFDARLSMSPGLYTSEKANAWMRGTEHRRRRGLKIYMMYSRLKLGECRLTINKNRFHLKVLKQGSQMKEEKKISKPSPHRTKPGPLASKHLQVRALVRLFCPNPPR